MSTSEITQTKEDNLLSAAEQYVHTFLLDHLPSEYVYHNYDHTQEVVEVAVSLAEKAGLSEPEKTSLLLSAWFLDTGYVDGSEGDVHERSAEYAENFLSDQQADAQLIDEVRQLILRTAKDTKPKSMNEKILADAQWSFLSRKRFKRRSNLWQMEEQYVKGEEIDDLEWYEHMLEVLAQTPFNTTWAHDDYSSGRNKNISSYQDNYDKIRKDVIRERTGKDFGRGVDTIYRVTLRNHNNLSSIADGKANMIISINTLVLSILITIGSASVSFSTKEIQGNISFIAPIIILMISSLSATIFAVLSAMPSVKGAEFTTEDIKNHKVSLLFFGNFLQIPKDEFVDHLNELKKNQAILYDELSRDLYALGSVLRRKYRLLIVSYRLFIGGLILSVLAFLIGSLLF